MKKSKPPAVTSNARTLKVVAEPGKSREALIADAATRANVPVAAVIMDFSKPTWGELSLGDVLDSLNKHAGKIKGGDLSRVEAMLGGQAAALNTMFAELARRGAVNMGEYIGAAETYLKLALKAQSQCRATLEALAAIKQPPVVFAKQANIAHGHQQVNNDSAAIARAEQIEKPQTELLEHDHGQQLDTGTAGTASCSDQTMATVEAVHGPAHGRRKSQGPS
jgi:hypothetical protein